MLIEKFIALNAPIDAVWAILLDPKRMIECVPGMKSVDVISDDEYLALMQVKISFISASFKLHTKIVERRAPHYLRAEGTGEDSSVASSLKQTTELSLSESEGCSTALQLKVKVDVVGRIASFGLSAMKTKADRLWDEFGTNLNAQLAAVREPAPQQRLAEPDTAAAVVTAAVQPIISASDHVKIKPKKIIIVGAGIIGVCTAHALLNDGHEVTLIDAQDGAARGASHANGGCLSAALCVPWGDPGLPKLAWNALFDRASPITIRPDFRLDQLRWLRDFLKNCKRENAAVNTQQMQALAQFSLTALNQLTSDTALEFDHRPTGLLLIVHTPEQRATMHPMVATLRTRGFSALWLDPEQVFAIEPALGHDGQRIAGGIFIENEGSGDCELFTQQLLKHCQNRGLKTAFSTAIQEVELDQTATGRKSIKNISSATATWHADAFVFATGVATRELLRAHLHVPVSAVAGYTMTARVVDASRAPRHAVIDHESKLAIAPMGEFVRVAGIAEWGCESNALSPERCQQLAATYERLYPGSADVAQARYWLGQRPMTPDGTPIIGQSGIEGLYLNVGHGTYGWTMACGAAQLLAGVVGDRPSALDSTQYDLLRYQR